MLHPNNTSITSTKQYSPIQPLLLLWALVTPVPAAMPALMAAALRHRCGCGAIHICLAAPAAAVGCLATFSPAMSLTPCAVTCTRLHLLQPGLPCVLPGCGWSQDRCVEPGTRLHPLLIDAVWRHRVLHAPGSPVMARTPAAVARSLGGSCTLRALLSPREVPYPDSLGLGATCQPLLCNVHAQRRPGGGHELTAVAAESAHAGGCFALLLCVHHQDSTIGGG
mmetsp:Transcript_18851/g.40589  ORF Transcript_18851/g.40589 Transcript_18851/m.40589 type:complete len:223 (+) Transcript_18851:1222-1890(+)